MTAIAECFYSASARGDIHLPGRDQIPDEPRVTQEKLQGIVRLMQAEYE